MPQRRAGQAVPGRKTQLDSADLTRADLVTLTIGGNDAGFVEVLVLCAVSNCNTQVFEQGRRAIIDGTRPALEEGLPGDCRQDVRALASSCSAIRN